MSVVDRVAQAVERRFTRRSFLSRAAMAATAITVAPTRFLLEPTSAYAAVTEAYCDSACSTYAPGSCDCGDLCCQGWTEFCCATHPETGNTCPPGTIPAGWWRADGSGLCDLNGQPMPRYYVDCNAECAPGCGGSGGICDGACHPDFPCECGQQDCAYRKTSCTKFRYGQCNSDVALVGAVVCRYVSCTPPWEWDPACSPTPVLWSNTTAGHDRACLHEGDPPGDQTTVIRLSGTDRFATAAAIAQDGYPDGSDTVFVATGHAFPDAVTGGAVAGKVGAPILLVARDSVPTATAAELTRLRPRRIVVLGGTQAVSAACAAELALYGDITRVAGPDRYATAVAVSRYGFDGRASIVVVATGDDFTDALSAAPLAVDRDGPILLTGRDALPPAVLDEIRRLRPSSILVIGGTGAVSDAVLDRLAVEGPTTRISGSSRYATSAAVSEEGFPSGSDRVLVTVGTDFPDGVAGGATAGAGGWPLLAVETYRLPHVVAQEIRRLGPSQVVVLGGPSAVSSEVANDILDLLP